MSEATTNDDHLLRSYALRHIGFHNIVADRMAAEAMLRDSLHVRSALGWRPLVPASQASLARLLEDTREADILIGNATRTATELDMRWLQAALARLS